LSLSLLLQNYKSTFIQKHTSPFLIGEQEWEVSESRTAMGLLLTEMLRLPLNLTGSYNTVRYPSFALHALENPEKTLRIKNIMRRFLKGGEVTYNDLRVTQDASNTSIYHDQDMDGTPEPYQVNISFEGLTLKTLGTAVREVLTPLKDRKQLEPLPGLIYPSRMIFTLPEKLVEDFLQYDPILASFYSTFMDSVYTKGNIFFDSKAAHEKGAVFQHMLKDLTILRFLEVGGYVEVPEGFYGSVTEEWHFE
ncbi:MAG: hypothetical protein JNJ47_00545, partial [Alphaproteobacteria bacterium]|nr:hypothetical protein [Alphaproteobacteria bacterium]